MSRHAKLPPSAGANIVEAENGRLRAAAGSPGGSTIAHQHYSRRGVVRRLLEPQHGCWYGCL